MKKFISFAALLLLTIISANTALARWMGNSAIWVNDTWYYGGDDQFSWCYGGAYNGNDLGYFSSSFLLGAQSQVAGGGTAVMCYKIDDGGFTEASLTWYDNSGSNGNGRYQLGGSQLQALTIDISNLADGEHYLEIYFYSDQPNEERVFDSNIDHKNYHATFHKGFLPLNNDGTGNSENLTKYNNKKIDVQLTGRTLVGEQWNTLCLPFNLPVSGSIFTDVKTLSGSSFNSDNGELGLTFSDATTIEAGKPYIVKVNSDIANPTFTNVTISAADPSPVGSAHATFIGTFDPETINGQNYLYLGAGNMLYWPNADVTINSFRAYFELNLSSGQQAGIKSFVLNFGDDNEETSIKQINNTESATNTYFTLDGRRLNEKPATAGLYIINGKKVVIK